jgi:hypothetical protein
MFQFPHLPRIGLCVQPSVMRYHPHRVAPFGFPRINACPQLPEAFRRVATSFIGRRRQGIHRAPSVRFSTQMERIARLGTLRRPRAGSATRSDCSLASLVSSIVNVPGGAAGIRTPDLRRAKAALSRLSYSPVAARRPVGVRGLEPRASPLSGVCSNQLSYTPASRPSQLRRDSRVCGVVAIGPSGQPRFVDTLPLVWVAPRDRQVRW